MNGTTAYVLARKYVKDTANKLGALKGAPCQIESITQDNGLYTITFKWEDALGTTRTSQIQMDDLGSLIEGNPLQEATEELVKIRIGNTVYAIPSGGGDYNNLINRPKINNVDLTTETTLTDLGGINEDDSLSNDQINTLLGLIPE